MLTIWVHRAIITSWRSSLHCGSTHCTPSHLSSLSHRNQQGQTDTRLPWGVRLSSAGADGTGPSWHTSGALPPWGPARTPPPLCSCLLPQCLLPLGSLLALPALPSQPSFNVISTLPYTARSPPLPAEHTSSEH